MKIIDKVLEIITLVLFGLGGIIFLWQGIAKLGAEEELTPLNFPCGHALIIVGLGLVMYVVERVVRKVGKQA
jgi:divalent metal cation (Fe/Co/Zn/Cd) transporter